MKTGMSSALGSTSARGLKIGIVGARFNSELSDALVQGAVLAIEEHGGTEDDITVVRVPGSYEVPLVCQLLAASGMYDALVATGVIIRGETPHFDHLSANVVNSIQQIALQCEIPIGFGVVLANTPDQAIDRATEKSNKGREASLAAIEMALTTRKIKEEGV